jgi:hypothetical protein
MRAALLHHVPGLDYSWWARRFYDTSKMNLAKQRFGERWS